MQTGTRLGPYEILETLGRGGMGDVYRARDTRLNRHVAIKTVSAAASNDLLARERFEREARAVAALSHPNVLAIYDVGSHGGLPYLAAELLEGETLRSRLRSSPLPMSAVVDHALQIGRGLAAAHDRGIVHRDLKPDNIFITADGQVKLLDFGLATDPSPRTEDDSTRLETTPGLVLGTAGYMSPEQARGLQADARSDIFAFGCVLFEMLSGQRAFKGATQIETIHAVLGEHPPDVTSLRPDVPPALDRVVRRCLEKTPAARFQSARDLVFAIETFAAGSGPLAPATPTAPVRPRFRRPAAALMAGLVVSGAAAAWWALAGRVPRQPVATATPVDGRRLLAVLPFENISPNGEGSFASGMTEEITSHLSKLNGLRVVARTAVHQFDDPRRQIAELAKELGIGSVVAGTVREDGTRVRVNVELIDAASGQLVWSEQYDRDGVDVFAAQSDIALRVGEALNASITLDERARVGKRPTSSVAAYELYIRARNAPGRGEQRLRTAIARLEEAVALDPQFADAYAEMANAYYFLGTYGDRAALVRGLAAAQKAIAIDPDHALGYRGLGLNLSQLGRIREALAAYHKAADLGPSISSVLSDLSYGESMAGRYDEAFKAAVRSSELARGPGAYHQGVALVLLNDDVRAAQYLTQKLEQAPDSMRLRILLAMNDLRRGEPQAAVDRIRDAAVRSPDNIEVLLTRAEILTFAGAEDAAEAVRTLLPRAADGLLHNAPYPVKLLHAYHLRRGGATREAERIEEAILAANRESLVGGADSPLIFMQNAAILALRRETPRALDELERAYAAGWRDGRMLAIDPLFASVRTEPRFQQVLTRIDADVSAMRGRADYSTLR
jgi:serine/threonine-protein kinase